MHLIVTLPIQHSCNIITQKIWLNLTLKTVFLLASVIPKETNAQIKMEWPFRTIMTKRRLIRKGKVIGPAGIKF